MPDQRNDRNPAPDERREPPDAIAERLTWRDWWPVTVAAVVALLLAGGLIGLFGSIASYQRDNVFAGLAGSVVWLAASVIGACGTIAALMLTTVGLIEYLDTRRLTPRFLFHLRLVVEAAIGTIGVAIVTLLITVFPTSNGEAAASDRLVEWVYWALLIATSLMVGGFATVLGALYTTVRDIFRTLPRAWVDEILTDEADA
jgi:hypothetical protein